MARWAWWAFAWCVVVAPCSRAQQLVSSSSRGYALRFDGQHSVAGLRDGGLPVDVDPALAELGDGNITVAFWVRFRPTQWYPGTVWRLVSELDNYLTDFQFAGMWLTLTNPGMDMIQASRPNLPVIGLWHHMAFVLRDNGMHAELHVDGQEVSRTQLVDAVQLSQQPGLALYFGALMYQTAPFDKPLTNNPSASFKGDLDEFVIWDKALSPAELAALPHLRVHDVRPENAVILYDFDILAADMAEGYGSPQRGGLVPNRGTAGKPCDLLLGQLNDEFGHGTSVTAVAGEGDQHPLGVPVLAPSDVPELPAEAIAHSPLVVLAMPDTSVELQLPWAASEVLEGDAELTAPSTLRLSTTTTTTNPEAAAAAAAAVASTTASTAGEAEDSVTVVALAVDGGRREVHLRAMQAPQETPAVADAPPRVVVTEGALGTLELGRLNTSPVGEPLELEVVEVPRHGLLRQCNTTRLLGLYHVKCEPKDVAGVGTRVTELEGGLMLAYEARAGLGRMDSLVVRFVGGLSGLRGKDVRVDLEVRAVNDLPDVVAIGGGSLELEEDAPDGAQLRFEVVDDDKSNGTALVVAVSQLPQHGQLFVRRDSDQGDEEGKEEVLVRDVYNVYDPGDVREQFVSEVVRVSTYLESVQGLKGPPTCVNPYEVGDGECVDERLDDPAFEAYVGMPVSVDLSLVGQEGPPRMDGEVRQVHAEHEQTTYDVWVPFQWRRDADGKVVQCMLVGTQSYPKDCDVAEAERLGGTGVLLERVPRGALGPLQSPLHFSFATNGERAGWKTNTEYDLRYDGPTHMFNYSQEANYREGGFTEFIEVAFPEEVFPADVVVGFARGGGSVVSVLALEPETGLWRRMYRAAAQRAEHAANTGTFMWFQENLCRPAFRTRTIRLEFDTSAATGITDWVMIDYIKLLGSRHVQPAMLLSTSHEIKYVPHADFAGEDSFALQAYDCGGAVLRSGRPAVVPVTVRGVPDDPMIHVQRDIQELPGDHPRRQELRVRLVEVDANFTHLLQMHRPYGAPLEGLLSISDGDGDGDVAVNCTDGTAVLAAGAAACLWAGSPGKQGKELRLVWAPAEGLCPVQPGQPPVVYLRLMQTDGVYTDLEVPLLPVECPWDPVNTLVVSGAAGAAATAALLFVACRMRRTKGLSGMVLELFGSPAVLAIGTLLFETTDLITDIISCVNLVGERDDELMHLLSVYVTLVGLAVLVSLFTLRARILTTLRQVNASRTSGSVHLHVSKGFRTGSVGPVPSSTSVFLDPAAQLQNVEDTIDLLETKIADRRRGTILLIGEDLPMLCINLALSRVRPSVLQDLAYLTSFMFNFGLALVRVTGILNCRWIYVALSHLYEHRDALRKTLKLGGTTRHLDDAT